MLATPSIVIIDVIVLGDRILFNFGCFLQIETPTQYNIRLEIPRT